MNIVSYRGPGMPGGVAASLSRLWAETHRHGSRWSYVSGTSVMAFGGPAQEVQQLGLIPQFVVDGHYRFCNNFLWPVMHDMPGQASYSALDHRLYTKFNALLARHIGGAGRWWSPWYFVQDYQLAFLSHCLVGSQRAHCLVFWHIPWPRSVTAQHAAALRGIARALLACEAIGFHTQEYAVNFLRFVDQHLPDSSVDWHRGLIDGRTQVLSMPLGVDLDHWRAASAGEADVLGQEQLAALRDRRFILSVDRADYTKGVAERLEMIDLFFERHAQYRGRVTFAQVCARTRPGLPAFDAYWSRCRQLAARLTRRWSEGLWRPLVWIETAVAPDELAILYREAEAMLVNPVRDGLNLTAKEFVACQNARPGVLLLSSGAGVWHELGNLSIPVNPQKSEQMADLVKAALTMRNAERLVRIDLMKEKLKQNTLHHWWCFFSEQVPELIRQASADAGLRFAQGRSVRFR
ncbi:MAG TPA: trehalose-6-phosphate synthase [Candidatus Obscuribacterales bacterium]